MKIGRYGPDGRLIETRTVEADGELDAPLLCEAGDSFAVRCREPWTGSVVAQQHRFPYAATLATVGFAEGWADTEALEPPETIDFEPPRPKRPAGPWSWGLSSPSDASMWFGYSVDT